ncbi:MAG: glycosyltransferase [Vicinamibacterales bacterium]
MQVVLSLAPGGTERLVVELVQRLNTEMPTAVCCLDREGAWGEQLKADGISVQTLNRQPGFHPLLGKEIAAIARQHKATVLHCHQYSPFVYGALARLWHPSLQVIFTEHGRLSDAPPSTKRLWANRLLWAHAPARVFAVSADLRQHIVNEGFPAARVGVIYNGIDIGALPTVEARQSMRRGLGLADNVCVVGTVARLDPVKDLGVLIAAVARLNANRAATLLVVGDGPERQRLEQVAQDADGGTSTRFLGHRDDARAVLAACDVFANSSISEGVSLTILEGMAAGLPVVATRVGGTPEVLDESCARLVPARNVEAMSEALRALSDDSALRAALGRAGRIRVEERFTLDRMVSEYRDAYLRASEN